MSTDGTTTANEGFALAEEDHFRLTTGELAKRLGVTSQTVRNHADKLGGAVARKDSERGWRFTPDAIAAWKRTVPAARTGGKRRNAGRKPIAGDKPLTQNASDIQATRKDIRERMTPDESGQLAPPPAGAMRSIDVLHCTKAELLVLVSTGGPREDLLDDPRVRRVSEVLDLQFKQTRLDKERGALVPADQVADAWSREAQRVRDRVQTLPKRVGPRVAAACWVGDELVADICRVLKDNGVEGGVITAVADMLAKPPELGGRVRALIEDEVLGVMREIAEGPD